MDISKTITTFIKDKDTVALTAGLKSAFYDKLGENKDFQDFAKKMEQYKPSEGK